MSAIEDLLQLVIAVAVPAFAIASMLSMGLRTPVDTFARQLRDRRSVIAVLMANFIVVPAVGTLIVWMLSPWVPSAVSEGFVIVLCAAGAPFVLQLGAMARIPFDESAGPMAVLLVGTVLYMPIVVPLLMRDVQVDAFAVAGLLLGTMLAPMVIGIGIAGALPQRAEQLGRIAGGVAAVAAVLMFLSGFGANSGFVLDLLLSPSLLVAIGIIALAFVAGRIAGEQAGPTLRVPDGPGILTSQRNIAAALLVARGAEHHGEIVVAILLTSAVGFVMLVPYAVATGLVRRRRAGERTTLARLIGVGRDPGAERRPGR
ncbi:Na+-dependent transporter [Brachybacterium endophyticum]|uniref:Na+-dependent transporter n=1 Tax=Brachybacterium endophyticum TaxID=2182385 RepID=A0A2U2RQ44_9MICO|nr:Na+-dependent transporter [Brachybacterium endophyticum]